MAQVEQLYQFIQRHDFLIITRIPSKQSQEVDDCFRQVTSFTITGRHITGLRIMPFQREYRETETITVTLAQLAVTVRLQEQRKVCKFRHGVCPAECSIKQHMKRSRRQPFFPTDDVRHFHQMVIHNVGQVISRQFVGTLVQYLIVQNRRIHNHLATNDVMNMYFFIRFNQETNHILLSFGDQSIHFLLRQGQGITHPHTGRGIVLEIGHLAALGIQFFRSIESNVSLTGIQQLLHILLVDVTAFRLAVRTIVSSKAHTLVELDAEPLERLNDILFRSRHKTIGVRIFYTENQITPMLTGKQIIIQGSTYTANM